MRANAGTAKLEETIEAESLKKSKAIDSALDKALKRPEWAGSRRQRTAGGRLARGRAPPAGGAPHRRVRVRRPSKSVQPDRFTTTYSSEGARDHGLKPTQWKLPRKSCGRSSSIASGSRSAVAALFAVIAYMVGSGPIQRAGREGDRRDQGGREGSQDLPGSGRFPPRSTSRSSKRRRRSSSKDVHDRVADALRPAGSASYLAGRGAGAVPDVGPEMARESESEDDRAGHCRLHRGVSGAM